MLTFTHTPGALFSIWGKCALLLAQERTNQAAQQTNLVSQTVGLVAQLGAESDVQALVGNNWVGLLNAGPGAVGGVASAVARAALNRLVYRDKPRPGQTLASENTLASALELIRQMKLAGAKVLAQDIAATVGAFSSQTAQQAGNAVINVSTRRPGDGAVLEHALGETLRFTCTSDSFLSGAAAGNESIRVEGAGAQNNPFAFDWPLGSGASLSLSVIDGNQDNAAGNLLTNSGFTNFTGNKPNNWEVVTGLALLSKEVSDVYDGGGALKITGDGGTLVRLRQQFSSSAGTGGELASLSQYSLNAFLRRDGTAPAAGRLAFRFTDASGAVINDAAGSPNTGEVDLTALTTSYAAQKLVFRTPLVLPAAIYLDIVMPAGHALTNGRGVYLDKMSLGGMQQVVRNGLFTAVHAGSVPLRIADLAEVVVTNGRGLAGTLNTFQTAVPRLIPEFWENELILPSAAAGSQTLEDATYIA